MKTKFVAFALVCTLALSSCKKDNNNTNTETKTEMLTKSAWKFEAFGLDMNMDNMLTGSEIESKACDMDDVISFSTSGTVSQNVGADNCGGTAASGQSTWQFYNNETVIYYKGNNRTIRTFTQNKLEIYAPGSASSYIWIFKR